MPSASTLTSRLTPAQVKEAIRNNRLRGLLSSGLPLPKGWYRSNKDSTGVCLSVNAAALELGCDVKTVRVRAARAEITTEHAESPERPLGLIMTDDGKVLTPCYGLSALEGLRSDNRKSLKRLATVNGSFNKPLWNRLRRAASKYLSPQATDERSPPAGDYSFPALPCARKQESAWQETETGQPKQLTEAPIYATEEDVAEWEKQYAINRHESKQLLKKGYKNTHQLGGELAIDKDPGRMRELGEILACCRKHDLKVSWARVLAPVTVGGSRPDAKGYREERVYEPSKVKGLWEADYLKPGIGAVREMLKTGRPKVKDARSELEKHGISGKRADRVIKAAKVRREHQGAVWVYVSHKEKKPDAPAIVKQILESGCTAGEAREQARAKGIPRRRFFEALKDLKATLESDGPLGPRRYVLPGTEAGANSEPTEANGQRPAKRKRRALDKHLQWKQWHDDGLGYKRIRARWKRETGEDVTLSTITSALRRLPDGGTH